MPEIMKQQLASHADNIQKLFEATTRNAESIKGLQAQQSNIDRHISEFNSRQLEMFRKLANIEANSAKEKDIIERIDQGFQAISELDRRLENIETERARHHDRWNRISTFVIQLVWVILAAYLLTKLHLQPPNIP